MLKPQWALVLCALAGASNAQATDARGMAALYGMGGVPCKIITQNPEFANDASKNALREWFFGYLSARNVESLGVFDLSPVQQPDGLFTLFYNRCKAMPDALVQKAASTLINAISVAQIPQYSPMVEYRTEQGSVLIRAAILARIQKALKKAGLFKGEADGKQSPALTNAIKAFQAKMKETPTGLPDKDIILLLVIEPAMDEAEKRSR